jgi:hypothetical protein
VSETRPWERYKHDPEGSGAVVLDKVDPRLAVERMPERPPNRAERRRNRVGQKARARAWGKEMRAQAAEARNAEAAAKGEGTPKGPISRWIRETGWRPPDA